MNGYLIDTNILSELARDKPDTKVVSFFQELKDIYLSVLTLHELNYGLELMPDNSKRRIFLTNKIDSIITVFGDRLISVGHSEAAIAATFRANAQKVGRTLHVIDLLIAATAFNRGLTVVTRNQKDFKGLGIEVLNPWS